MDSTSAFFLSFNSPLIIFMLENNVLAVFHLRHMYIIPTSDDMGETSGVFLRAWVSWDFFILEIMESLFDY